jgi:hypothetical protein
VSGERVAVGAKVGVKVGSGVNVSVGDKVSVFAGTIVASGIVVAGEHEEKIIITTNKMDNSFTPYSFAN